ncbi:MAG: CobD/CbiB family protein [Candidatus Accumulibacter sp.]|uniref:CobD/CbiB family protein n=1 Tax=Accumulibacter sp. TaxID=2053492 RepID=UPI0028784590|nr:CobD/CbiB family protein [Accumulibacter sp.]MDS4012744.1 CobD/CbiB family protein [Accumulibacter sp.]
MSFLSLLTVLLVEYLRPLPYGRFVQTPLARLADFLESRLSAGERRQGILAWCIGVGGLIAAGAAISALLNSMSPLLAWLWDVFILYLAIGFRRFGDRCNALLLALRRGETARAAGLLAAWRGCATGSQRPADLARLTIEETLAASHRHLFAVLVWFLVLPGPCGAILYRTSASFAEAWSKRQDTECDDFGSFARRSFAIIDWLPARFTAATFAIVGNFEDAVYCWRSQTDRFPDDGLGIVLASGAGALGVRLEMPDNAARAISERVVLGTGEEAEVDFIESAVGLVWRALVLWVLSLLLLGLAGLVGV